MITLEKFLILKTIKAFEFTSEEVLLHVAGAVKEELVPADTVIVKEGELGDIMYMIHKGAVKIIADDKVISTLGERQVFGELAALSPEKRTASVVASEPTSLLTIDGQTLYALMELHPGLVKGIVLMLCERARSMMKH